MAEYYLISQLPSLDGISDNIPLPVTEEKFTELCRSFLNKKALKELEQLSIIPSKAPVKSTSPLIEKWNEGERSLRFLLAKLRAEKAGKRYDIDMQSFNPLLVNSARTAIEIESPMEAEKFLNRCRLDFLESLRPTDSFSTEFVFYYGLRLKLLERMRKFDSECGEAAYRKIYDSIMNSDRSEVI